VRSKTILSVVSLFGLALVGTAQGASQPGGGGSTPPPTGPSQTTPHYVPYFTAGGANPNAIGNLSCTSAPTLALCNNSSYQQCHPNAEAECKPIVEAAGATYASGTTATCLMDATGDHCVPTQIKAFPATYAKNPGTDWQAQEAAAARNALVALGARGRGAVAVTPATYTRNASWSDKTKPINSCEAYIYAKYWDYERYLDATYACGTDDQCVFDTTFLNYKQGAGAQLPGIAKRTMVDRDNVKIAPSMAASEGSDAAFLLNGGADLLPKNAFYASAAFIPPAVFDALVAAWASDPAMVAELQTLRAQLEKGYNFYNYGGHPGLAVEYTGNAWDWHMSMNNRTKPKAYPHAQQVEFLSRNEKVSENIWALGSALACANLSLPCVALPLEVARVTPGMAESYPADPFSMASILTKNDRFSIALQGAIASSLVPSQIPAGGFGINIGAIGGAPFIGAIGAKSMPYMLPGTPVISSTRGAELTVRGTADAVYSPVPPMRPTWTGFPADYWTKIDFADKTQLQYASYTLAQRWRTSPPVVAAGRGGANHPRLDCSGIDPTMDPVLSGACDLTNTVLDEWARKLNGNESCLDMNGYGCDWSPLEFRKSVIGSQKMQASREADYKECIKYTHNRFTAPGAPQLTGAVPTASQLHWKDIWKVIDNAHKALDAFNKKVPIIEQPTDPKFDHAIGTVYGDHSNDGQQWGNDIFGAGYHYDIGWDAAVVRKDSSNVITGMQLGFNGEFDAHVSAFGNDISLLEVQLGAKVNENDSAEVDAAHYLYVVGFGSFDGLRNKGYSKVANISDSFTLADPHDEKSANVFDAGFWVGPVYVHVGIDIELHFDAPLEGNVAMPKKDMPLKSGDLIEATLTFHPKAGVSADLYAYGGWGPIAEVGVEAKLNLITVGLPMTSSIGVKGVQLGNNSTQLTFHVREGIDVSISTLSGEIDICGKIIGIGGCAKMVSWKGLEQRFPLFTAVNEEFPLALLNN
jgi:hypothetical protein